MRQRSARNRREHQAAQEVLAGRNHSVTSHALAPRAYERLHVAFPHIRKEVDDHFVSRTSMTREIEHGYARDAVRAEQQLSAFTRHAFAPSRTSSTAQRTRTPSSPLMAPVSVLSGPRARDAPSAPRTQSPQAQARAPSAHLRPRPGRRARRTPRSRHLPAQSLRRPCAA